MGKLRSWRRGVVTAALVGFVFVAAALAWNGSASVWGSNEPGSHQFGLFTSGYAESTPQGCGGEGYPYVEAKTDGYGEWVGGSAYYCAGGVLGCGWCAQATSEATGVVPFGNYTGTARIWVNNTYVGEKKASNYFNDPEPEEGDGSTCQAGTDENCNVSPILIPTGQSQAIRLTSVANGVLFDLRANGVPVQTAWTVAGSEVAFLALDRNGNGVIDSGSELFGDATYPGVGNGFAALRLTEGAGADGSVGPDDPLFASLLLWTDRNHNGISEADELRPVSDIFDAIGLGYTYAERRDGFGNEYRYRGWARKLSRAPKGTPRPGDFGLDVAREIKIFDVFFRVAK